MNVTFASKKLQQLCNKEKKLRGKYGIKMAAKIQLRLDHLRTVDDLSVMRLMPGRCHELVHNLKGLLALDLVHPARLVFRPNHDPIPSTREGALIWESVTDVTIVEIGDYHS